MRRSRLTQGFTFVQRLMAWVTTLIVCGFMLLVVGTYLFSCVIKLNQPPSIKDAPWIVQTSSRSYYASQYSVVNGVPTITDYWTLDGKDHYQFRKGSIPFPKREFGQIAVIRRTQ